MNSNDDELIGLNLSEKPVRGDNYSAYALRCPSCGCTDYRETRLPENYQNSVYSLMGIEHNTCNACGVRFSEQGDEEAPHHELRGILYVLGIMGGVFALVVIVGIILQFLKKL